MLGPCSPLCALRMAAALTVVILACSEGITEPEDLEPLDLGTLGQSS
jgi:hypothetical protein